MLMSSVLRLSMVSLMPLLTELLSSQLPRQRQREHHSLTLFQPRLAQIFTSGKRPSLCHNVSDKALLPRM